MANIYTGQQQIRIIPTWIVRAITKVLKKAINVWGPQHVFCAGMLFTKDFVIFGHFMNIH